MFAMFAMTTDSVGMIIPEIIKTFHLSLTAAGTFQYATMGGIALAGFLLGHLADRYGRKPTIVAGLMLVCRGFLPVPRGKLVCVLLRLDGHLGLRHRIFKTGALALIGDICQVDGRTHFHHEHRRRILWRRIDSRPGSLGVTPAAAESPGNGCM